MLEVRRELVTAPEPVITSEQLAAHLRLSDDSEGPELSAYIAAATDAVQGYLKRPVPPQTWRFYWPESADKTEIGFSPVIEILDTSSVGGFTVQTARVGFDPVPPSLILAIKLLAADFYEHRHAQTEINLQENRSYRFLLANYKQEFAY